MRKIAIIISFFLPFILEKFLNFLPISWKGFDLGSTKKFNLIKHHLNINPSVLVDVGVNREIILMN